MQTGLGAEELWDLVDTAPGEITDKIQEAAKRLGVYVVWPSYRRGEVKGQVWNSAILINPDGGITGIYDKTHPAPWERRDGGGWVEVGTRADVFETDLGSIGMMNCYDGDFPELSRLMAVKGAEVIVRPSALQRSYDIWYIIQCRAGLRQPWLRLSLSVVHWSSCHPTFQMASLHQTHDNQQHDENERGRKQTVRQNRF